MQRADRVEHGDDGHREQRRVRAVAPGRLAVAADPEAGEGEQERREPERAELRDVEHEPGPEAEKAPKIEPVESETATRRTSTRSGEPPRIPIEETIVTCTTTAKKKSTADFATARVMASAAAACC